VSERKKFLNRNFGFGMNGATMLATLQRLGVMPSFSRPSVRDDNPFCKTTHFRESGPAPLSGWV
jgi:hypothetical protein